MTNPEKNKKVAILQHSGCASTEGVYKVDARPRQPLPNEGQILILVCNVCGSKGVMEDLVNPLAPQPSNG